MCYTEGAAGGLSVIPPLVPYLTNHQKESSRMVPPGGNIIGFPRGVLVARPTEKDRQRASAPCLFSFRESPGRRIARTQSDRPGILDFRHLAATLRRRENCAIMQRVQRSRTDSYISFRGTHRSSLCSASQRRAQKRKESYLCQQQQSPPAQDRPPRARAAPRTSPTSSSTATPRNPTIR